MQNAGASRWQLLLGAYDAQIELGLPSIGGKDSMSGTFNDIDVPPTLCSFAVDVAEISDVVTNGTEKSRKPSCEIHNSEG